MILKIGKRNWKDHNTKKVPYYLLFVIMVNRFLSKQVVLVSITTFEVIIFAFICLHRMERSQKKSMMKIKYD